MALITILLLIPMYFINILIGGEANYWYLMVRPAGESLMDLMPDPLLPHFRVAFWEFFSYYIYLF